MISIAVLVLDNHILSTIRIAGKDVQRKFAHRSFRLYLFYAQIYHFAK